MPVHDDDDDDHDDDDDDDNYLQGQLADRIPGISGHGPNLLDDDQRPT